MSFISVDKQIFDLELIVFDKDGTLIDLHSMWGARACTVSTELATLAYRKNRAQNRDEHHEEKHAKALQEKLLATLGYDKNAHRICGDSPLACAPLAKLYSVTSTVLYQHGIAWTEAEGMVKKIVPAVLGATLRLEDIKPLADLKKLFNDLIAHGLSVAIATSDNRTATEATLQYFGIHDVVSAIVCGDDEGVPNKPEPALLHGLANTLNVDLAKIMMVGDTDTDMQMGRAAGVAVSLGVLSGAGTHAQLAPFADVITESIANIRIGKATTTT